LEINKSILRLIAVVGTPENIKTYCCTVTIKGGGSLGEGVEGISKYKKPMFIYRKYCFL